MSTSQTIIIRHQKENLKKCSLRGISTRPEISSYRYPPKHPLPNLDNHILLTLDAPPLTLADAAYPIILIDGTWRLAGRMLNGLKSELTNTIHRSIPPGFTTAYPRKQTEETTCPDPDAGLASIEALYIAYLITNRPTAGLLDHYLWADDFLQQNHDRLQTITPTDPTDQ